MFGLCVLVKHFYLALSRCTSGRVSRPPKPPSHVLSEQHYPGVTTCSASTYVVRRRAYGMRPGGSMYSMCLSAVGFSLLA